MRSVASMEDGISSDSSDSESVEFELSSLGGLAILHVALQIGCYAVPYNQGKNKGPKHFLVHCWTFLESLDDTRSRSSNWEKRIRGCNELVTSYPVLL